MTKKNNRKNRSKRSSKHKLRNTREKERETYAVLVDDIDDDNEPAVFFSIVDKSYPPDLHVSLERLQDRITNTK
jgi:hypothetical protein